MSPSSHTLSNACFTSRKTPGQCLFLSNAVRTALTILQTCSVVACWLRNPNWCSGIIYLLCGWISDWTVRTSGKKHRKSPPDDGASEIGGIFTWSRAHFLSPTSLTTYSYFVGNIPTTRREKKVVDGYSPLAKTDLKTVFAILIFVIRKRIKFSKIPYINVTCGSLFFGESPSPPQSVTNKPNDFKISENLLYMAIWQPEEFQYIDSPWPINWTNQLEELCRVLSRPTFNYNMKFHHNLIQIRWNLREGTCRKSSNQIFRESFCS